MSQNWKQVQINLLHCKLQPFHENSFVTKKCYRKNHKTFYLSKNKDAFRNVAFYKK